MRIKWIAILVIAVAILCIVVYTAIGNYSFELAWGKVKTIWGPAGSISKTEVFKFGHPEIENVTKKYLSESSLFSLERVATYKIKSVYDDHFVYAFQCVSEIVNKSDKPISTKMEFHFAKTISGPEVLVDGVEIHPMRSSHPSGLMSTGLYEVIVLAGETKEIQISTNDNRCLFNEKIVELSILPTISYKLFVEGKKNIMHRLKVHAAPTTWRDNWEVESPFSEKHVKYGWKTKYPTLPYQGAIVVVGKDEEQGE
jgi:hypothetical protein